MAAGAKAQLLKRAVTARLEVVPCYKSVEGCGRESAISSRRLVGAQINTQGLKPKSFCGGYGTSKLVPLHVSLALGGIWAVIQNRRWRVASGVVLFVGGSGVET
jgi:hypothetical protein